MRLFGVVEQIKEGARGRRLSTRWRATRSMTSDAEPPYAAHDLIGDVIFDNASHTATGSCTGVNNASLAGLNLSGTSHKDAGVYTDAWTFTDVTGNYNNTSEPVVDRIGHWTTEGFYQPVDMSGAQIVWNTVKGGSTGPLKFNLSAGAQKKTSVADVKTSVYSRCRVSRLRSIQ